MRRVLVPMLLIGGACHRDPLPPAAPPGPTTESLAAEVALARAGCVRCHAADAPLAARLAPGQGPALAEAVRWHADDAGRNLLQRHHGGTDGNDLAAWIVSLAAEVPAPSPTATTAGAVTAGERLWRELACGTCHADAAMEGLAARVDHARLAAFLHDPTAHRPGRAHLALTDREADGVAAWLLRAQQSRSSADGFGWACFERKITDAGLPDLAGAVPKASGVTDRVGPQVATRKDHYVLRFDATLDVPAAGEWAFVTDSDDSSWLWIDGDLVVKNEGIAPHRRKDGKRTLTPGPHELRVMFTQAAGESILTARWRGPGVDEEELPALRAKVQSVVLTPPPPPPAPAAAAVARGRAAAARHRCDACHTIADAAFAASPPSTAKAFASLGDGPCPEDPAAQALLAAARGALVRPADAATALGTALLADGCLSCHTRDGKGGLPPAVKQGLTMVEDLGDEGRLPPDLTAVGRRLRPDWIVDVLHEGRSVRPYLRVRMPALPIERAKAYAEGFAGVDGMQSAPPAPPFSSEAVLHGRDLVGIGARNCITCHRVQGHASIGIQGMDLAIQAQRLQPAWLREWLLRPDQVRPGTRMPRLWISGDDADRAEVEAIAAWLGLGAAAPLPRGVPKPDALVLEPVDRVLQHGAFLKGLSARCLAVGTPERAHFAFDLSTARLRWLWRGAFLDAAGTWEGRAGQLLEPKGQDWIVLADAEVNGGGARRLLGRRTTADGYPVLRVAVGDAEYEDELHAHLAAGGSELVRTLRCTKGALRFDFTADREQGKPTIGEAPAGVAELVAGKALEVVYAW